MRMVEASMPVRSAERGTRHVARPAAAAAGVLASLALAVAGCGREYVYFRPAENPQGASPGWVAQGRYRVPPGEGAVEVSLSARGMVEAEKGEDSRRTLEVRFAVRNQGQATWSLDPAQTKIVDDDGRQVAGARAWQGRSRMGAILIAGGASEAFSLTFDLPEEARFESLGSLRVAWPYRYGDKPYEGSTKFIRIEEVTYYYPDYYGPYYGPYFYGPYYGPYYAPPYWRPYHGPYYYDPWYDPWLAYRARRR